MSSRIPPRELDFKFTRSQGAGGQNVNKLNTRVTLIWSYVKSESVSQKIKNNLQKNYKRYLDESGQLQISSQRFRSQARNIADCIQKLERIIEACSYTPKKRKATQPTKSSQQKRIESKKIQSDKKRLRKKIDY